MFDTNLHENFRFSDFSRCC